MHLGLEDWFTGNEFHYNVPFSGLNLRDQVYTWLSAVVVPGVLPIVRNDGSGIELGCVDRLTLGDGQSLRVGAIRLRKISSKPSSSITDYLEEDWKGQYRPRVYRDYVGPGITGCSVGMPPLADEDDKPFYSTYGAGGRAAHATRLRGPVLLRAGAAPHLPSNKCPSHRKRDVFTNIRPNTMPTRPPTVKSLLQKRRAATPSHGERRRSPRTSRK